jgi:hypothetical protein
MRRLPAALAIALLPGCGPSGFTTLPGDWAGYRATRVSTTFEERLAASQRYLEEHPNGAFHAEVRAAFDHAEELFFQSKQGSRAGLEAYLHALPKGPHHEDAEHRLRLMDDSARSKQAETAAVESKVAGPEASARIRVREQVKDWLGRFLDASVWTAPLSEAKESLVVPFSLSLPGPRCEVLEGARRTDRGVRRCVKILGLPYVVATAKGSEPREATLEIAVIEDASGTPVEATLGGPDLFARIEETHRVRSIGPDDVEERTAAFVRMAETVRAVFAGGVSPDPACKRAAAPPAFLVLACAGVRVSIRAAAAPGEDDQVVIAPFVP